MDPTLANYTLLHKADGTMHLELFAVRPDGSVEIYANMIASAADMVDILDQNVIE